MMQALSKSKKNSILNKKRGEFTRYPACVHIKESIIMVHINVLVDIVNLNNIMDYIRNLVDYKLPTKLHTNGNTTVLL